MKTKHPSNRERAAYLRGLKWSYVPFNGGGRWFDACGRWVANNDDDAYRLARKRQAARERALLRQAGFYYSPFKNETWDAGWFDAGHNWKSKTRAEALKLAQGRQK